MKAILSRVFARRRDEPASSQASALSSELTSGDIETYYLRVITDVFRRLMVPPESIEIGVKRAGVTSHGLPAYCGYVRILKWDPLMAPVLLQNLPVIDARVRKVVAASLLLEHTYFAGLWLQASSRIEGAPKALVGMPTELVMQSVSPN